MKIMLFSSLLLLSLILPFQKELYSQFSPDISEEGNLPVYNFNPLEYNAADQNWCGIQDSMGITYFGNNWGVLQYDGVNWNLIKVRNASSVRSITIDKTGKIFVGANNDLGYISNDYRGELKYYSLYTFLPIEYRDFGDIWNTCAIDTFIYFQTSNSVFRWDGKMFTIIDEKCIIKNMFLQNGRLLLSVPEKGLAEIIGEKLIFIQGAEFLKNKEITGMIGCKDSSYLISISNKGLFRLSIMEKSTSITKVNSDADIYLKKFDVYKMLRIDSTTISCGTWGGGIVLIDNMGNLIRIIDKTNNLQDQVIQSQFIDRFKNLWLSLSNGISRIEINSAISQFKDINGLEGTVQSVCRYNNELYVATSQGLFHLENKKLENESIIVGKTFSKEKNFPFECWKLLNYIEKGCESLLIITNNAVYCKEDNNAPKLIIDKVPYEMYQSKLDPKRVYIGLENGLMSIYRMNGNWAIESPFNKISMCVSSISEDHTGNLWLGSFEEGVLKLHIEEIKNHSIEKYKVTSYDSIQGLPAGPFLFEIIDGKVILATNVGFYKYSTTEDSFIYDSLFYSGLENKKSWIHRIKLDKNDHLWAVTFNENEVNKYQLGYFRRDQKYHWHTKPFHKISENIIHEIYPENNIIWLGGPSGLYRYQFSESVRDSLIPYHCIIRKIKNSRDSTIYYGNILSEKGTSNFPEAKYYDLRIPYKDNNLSFYFSAFSGTDEKYIEYSVKMEGFEKEWSQWTNRSFKEFTNLSEGKYIFNVKSRDVNGNISMPDKFKFTILPPWYRTLPAYIAWIILSMGFIFLIVAIYTRSLRSIIHQRTAEIRIQKEEIEVKNKDIMDSIQYARRIQNALLPPGDYLDDIFPQRFILYLPKDIVSGDFYWLTSKNERIYFVTADCTGHGVPGAMMSMLGMAFLKEISAKDESLRANDILNHLRSQIIESMRQTGQTGENQDGMDMALYILDMKTRMLEFSGANLSLNLYRNGSLLLYKGDKMPLGISSNAHKPFTNHEIQMEKGDHIYTFSDGFQDQFGGISGKKFLVNNLRCLLSEISLLPFADQKEKLLQTFQEWKGPGPQTDDVLVLGVRV